MVFDRMYILMSTWYLPTQRVEERDARGVYLMRKVLLGVCMQSSALKAENI